MEGSERYYIEGFSTTTMEDGDTRTFSGHGWNEQCRTASKEATTAKTSTTSSRNEKIQIRSSRKAMDRRSGCAGNSTT